MSYGAMTARESRSRYSTSNVGARAHPRASTATATMPSLRLDQVSSSPSARSSSAGGYATARSSSSRRWVDVTSERPKLTGRRSLAPKSSINDSITPAGSSSDSLSRTAPVKSWENSSLSSGSYLQTYLKQKGYSTTEDGQATLVAPWDHGPAPHPRQRDPMPTARSKHPPVGAEPEPPKTRAPHAQSERTYGQTRILDQSIPDVPRRRVHPSVAQSSDYKSSFDEEGAMTARQREVERMKDVEVPVEAPYRWRKTPEPRLVPQHKAEAVQRTLGTTFQLNYGRDGGGDGDVGDGKGIGRGKSKGVPHTRRQQLISGQAAAPWSEERSKLELETDITGSGAVRTPRSSGRKHINEPRVRTDMNPPKQESSVVPPYMYEKQYRPRIGGLKNSTREQMTTSDEYHTIPLDNDSEAVRLAQESVKKAETAMKTKQDAPWTKDSGERPHGPKAYSVAADATASPLAWDGTQRQGYDLHAENKRRIAPEAAAKVRGGADTFNHVLPAAGTSQYASIDAWKPTARDPSTETEARQVTMSQKQAKIEARRQRMAERSAVETRLRQESEAREVASLAKMQRHRDLYSDPLSL